MTATSYNPKGHCPKCGYAMDPGICPECGTNVTADRLRKRPRFIVWWPLLALVIVVLLVTGFGRSFYSRIVPHLPTSVLLLMQGDKKSYTTMELVSRLRQSSLTDDAAERLLRNACNSGPMITTRDPYPHDIPIDFKSSISVELPDNCKIDLLSSSIKAHGQVVDDLSSAVTRGTYKLGKRHRISNLGVGKHRITISYEVTLLHTTSSGSIPTAVLSTTRELEIAAQPLSEFVTGVYSKKLARQIERNAFADASGGVVLIDWSGIDVPFADAVAYAYVSECDFGWVSLHVPWWNVQNKRYNLSFSSICGSAVSQQFDIIWMGDPKTAFDAGRDEYFAGFVEWRSVDSSLQSMTGRRERQNLRPPSRVAPLSELDDDWRDSPLSRD